MHLQKNYYDICEEEAIKLSITLGESGSEFQTSAWKNRGCLKPDNTLEAFIKKLRRHFESVEPNGKDGKKRRYTLFGLKSEPSPKLDYRKGRKMPISAEDKIIMQYVYNGLTRLDNVKLNSLTINRLLKKIPIVLGNEKRLQQGVYNCFNPYLTDNKKIYNIFSYTNHYIDHRLIQDMKLAIKNLKAQGLLTLVKKYIAKCVNEGKREDCFYERELNEQEVNEIKAFERVVVESRGFDYSKYRESFHYYKKLDEIRSLEAELKNEFIRKFNIEYYYEAFDIVMLEEKIQFDEISYNEAKKAFLQKSYNLITKKSEKESYQNGRSMEKKFHYLCMLIYLKIEGFTTVYSELEQETNLIPDRLGEIVKVNEEIRKSNRPKGFGRVS